MATFYFRCDKCKTKQGKKMTDEESKKYFTTKQHKAEQYPICKKCGTRLALISDDFLAGIFSI